ncbi:MAG: hypothetical protein GY951_01175 [Psychromonas sp.]|nr:hypothetical protein [Psychromonas sp.]
MFKRFFICFRIINGNLFAINIRGRYKRHIMMIALYVYFSACGTSIAEPSFIKSLSFVPRQNPSELFNNDLEVSEFGFQNMFNINRVFRPVYRIGINIFQFGQYSITELLRGDSKSVSLVVKANEISHDCNRDKSAANFPSPTNNHIDEIGHKFLKGMWVGLIISSFIFFVFKHNVVNQPHRFFCVGWI